MLSAEGSSLRNYPPPQRPETPVQLLQGWYYLVGGLWVTIWITSLQSPTLPWIDLYHDWIVRIAGLCVAVVGVWLIYSSRRAKAPRGAILVSTFLSISLALSEAIALFNGVLPTTFLIEVGFFVWWMFVISIWAKGLSGMWLPKSTGPQP